MTPAEVRRRFAELARQDPLFVSPGDPTESDLLVAAVKNPESAFCGPRPDAAL